MMGCRYLTEWAGRAIVCAAASILLTATAHSTPTITDATYTPQNGRLVVEGTADTAQPVTVINAYDFGQALGTDVPRKNGRWTVRVNKLSQVPCRVIAKQGSTTDERDVTNAPPDCAPKSFPPELTPIGDQTVVEGNTLTFGVSATDDGPPPLTLSASPLPGTASFTDNGDGTGMFTWPTQVGDAGQYSVTFTATDGAGLTDSETITITVTSLASGQSPKNSFNILMNYELGMHCTGFEFSYCCVLPPYNSILAQVVKTEKLGNQPMLLEGDPNEGLDFLGRPTVLRDPALDSNGNFKKYVLRYWHDAQPRTNGLGAPQSSTLISTVEGNSLLMWNTPYDSAAVDSNNALVTGNYEGVGGVVLGDGDMNDAEDNYANGWLNHLYVYSDLEGSNPGNSSLEKDKIRLGLPNTQSNTPLSLIVPENSGPAFHPVGPGSTPGLENVLTFSGDTGTVVYTQMKVLENLPVMLTSPRIWEALGLPLTPFEDTINFFVDPGAVTEETVRPYVKMNAALHYYDPAQPGGIGDAVLDNGLPVTGFGDAPIDIPNCDRCHTLADGASVNSAQNGRPDVAALVQDEIEFWNAYYNVNVAAGDSDWYSRLKGAAISILAIHDEEHGTSFTADFPATHYSTCTAPSVNEGNSCTVNTDCDSAPGAGDGMCTGGALVGPTGLPQDTRLGHGSVFCQKCHADNVIGVVKSGTHLEDGELLPPLTEAIHNNHKDNPFSDSLDRNGGCQGCHPAHRSDGQLASYPITELGLNAYADGDNRDAAGGCFVGRDVHSNRNKDNDGAETPSHLNPVGQWLVDNVVADTGTWKGIWCTNCHTQLSQELWKAENVEDLVHAKPGDPGHVREPFIGASLSDVASAIGVSLSQAETWLDPKTNADTATIWNPDPGLCEYLSNPSNPDLDANVATIEVAAAASNCSTGYSVDGPDCDGDSAPDFQICGSLDGDNDFSVSLLDFCTTPDCVADAQATLSNSQAVPVPFSAAADSRDHWLAPGEPHCADCHSAPYVEQSGNINFFPPFNYPRKASLNRYSRGHQDITCQGCHESIHGLYPVTADIDTTTYAQAASLNADGSHGPLKCASCHESTADGIADFATVLVYDGQQINTNFDAAVSWAHTYTDEADVRDYICTRCHEDRRNQISSTNGSWTNHTDQNRVSRQAMDKAEVLQLGHVAGDPDVEDPLNTVCVSCHRDRSHRLAMHGCTTRWKQHLTEGRAAYDVWEYVSNQEIGSTCGW